MLSTLSPPAPAGERRFACDPLYWPPAARAIAALAPDQCRWPLGEPDGTTFAFCSDTRAFRSRYCAAHGRRARPGSPS